MGFDVVHGCQLRCIGCPNSTIKPKIYHITIDDYIRCMNNVDVSHIKVFRFFNFGEALLHPNLPVLVNQIRSFSFKVKKVEMSTNAQNYNFEHLKEMLKGRQLDILAVSCDGDGSPEDYERIRTPAKWEKLVEFLRKTGELRDKYHPDLKLLTRTICGTRKGQEKWKNLVKPYGWTPQFREWLELPQSNRTLEKNSSARNGLCHYLKYNEYYCYVDADGVVVPCCLHPKAFVLGNLKEQRLSEILLGETRLKFQKKLTKNRDSLPICSKCDVFI